MNAIETLIHECLKNKKSPECVLALQEEGDFSFFESLAVDDACTVYTDSMKRLPKVTELYILIKGCRAAKTVSNFLLQMTDTTKYFPVPFETLWQAGISLSWWLFGLGTQLHIPLLMSSETNETSLVDNIRIMRYKQGWSDLESHWMISQIHGNTENKTAHIVIAKIMQDMLPLAFFPEMPDVYTTYERLCTVIQHFEISKFMDSWMRDAILLLQKSPWRACTLFFCTTGFCFTLEIQSTSSKKNRTSCLCSLTSL